MQAAPSGRLVHPSSTPDKLDDRLPAAGLSLVEKAFGMSLDLEAWEPSTPTTNSPVTFARACAPTRT
jgi:hypothetical protein